MVRQILIVLALASLVAGTSAKRNLERYCADLSHSMSLNAEVYSNAQVAMEEAVSQLRSFSNVNKESRLKLASAWEAVVREEQCSSRSGSHVALIARCNPDSWPEMKSLSDAVRKYAERCLTASFWDEKLADTLRGLFGDKDRSGLTKFMDDKFIERYQQSNPNERKLHLERVRGQNCCRPWRSHKALLKALEPILEQSPGEMMRVLRDDVDTLEKVLQKNLFKPCEIYVRATFNLMDQASKAANYYRAGSDAFIEGLSREFQNAIFRYKYCEAFPIEDGSFEKLDKINVYEFFSQ